MTSRLSPPARLNGNSLFELFVCALPAASIGLKNNLEYYGEMRMFLSYSALTKSTKLLFLVLCISFFLRVFLVFSGGQNYWPDETFRYGQFSRAFKSALSGNIRGAISGDVMGTLTPEHFLFKAIAFIPAAVEAATSPNPKIPAFFFMLFSTLNVWLLWKLSRTMGSSDYEALITAIIFSLSTSFFYYCRHILPYDLGMTFGLLAVIAALKEQVRRRDSFLCGLMASCTFLTYNGYWTMACFALLAHSLSSLRRTDQFAGRAFFSGIGFILPILLLLSLGAACGVNMLQYLIGISNVIIEGVFSEGWSLPAEYLWHAEHFLFIFWCAAFVYCLWEVKKGHATKQVVIGIGGVLFMYSALVIFSVVLHKFVVFGRLARQCVPFFCILTAHWLYRLRTSDTRGKYISYAVLLFFALQAGFNFYQPMVQVFPEDFRKTALNITAASKNHQYDLIVIDNINYSTLLQNLSSLKPHRTVIQSPNPLEFLPYQYEGFTPDERNKLKTSDITMRLIEYAIK